MHAIMGLGILVIGNALIEFVLIAFKKPGISNDPKEAVLLTIGALLAGCACVIGPKLAIRIRRRKPANNP